MSVSTVNNSGDVVEPEFTHREAVAWIDDMRHDLDVVRERVIIGFRRRVWKPLGYSSWQTMCQAEFTGAMIRLPREDRPEFVQQLRAAGMSRPAIAAALGIGETTVRRDSPGSPNGEPADAPKVTGTDGKQYSGTRKRPEPEPFPEPERDPYVPPTPGRDPHPNPPKPEPTPPVPPVITGTEFAWVADVYAAVMNVVVPAERGRTEGVIIKFFLTATFASLHPEDQKTVYRDLSRKFHPDFGGDSKVMAMLSVALKDSREWK